MPDPKVNVKITADDQTKKGVSSAKQNLGGIVATGLGVALGGAIGAIPGLVSSAVGSIGDLAAESASLLNVEEAFKGINEAAGTGMEEMLAALREGAIGMVTNRDLMLSFNKASQLVSVDFAQRLPDAMGALGKVSAATGQDMGFLLDSLVTGVGRLSPMILDNLGIQVDMTEAMKVYASSVGKSTDELSKQEQQTALMNQVMEKLMANTANMPEIQGTAAASMGQLQATMDNLKDEIGKALIPAIIPLLDLLADLAADFLPMVANFIVQFVVPALKDMTVWLRDNLPPAIEKVRVFWVNKLEPALQKIWKFLSVDMLPIWEALGELLEVAIPLAITAVQGAWQNVLKPILDAIWEFISTHIIPIFGEWSDAIGGISGAISKVADWIGSLKDSLASLELPSWLMPGSPTPFELGLRGISEAMREVNQTSRTLAFAPANMGASSNNTTNTQNTWNLYNNAGVNSAAREYNIRAAMTGA